jgi:hypothetical protein
MPTNNVHPSFAPLWHRVPEEGAYSKHAAVCYDDHDHDHMVLLGDGHDNAFRHAGDWDAVLKRSVSFEDIQEEVIQDMLDSMRSCPRSRHLVNEADVRLMVVWQIHNIEFDREWAEYEWKERMFHKWGDQQMPALVLHPSEADPTQMDALIPDSNGDPVSYGVGPLADAGIPTPTLYGASKQDFGWHSPRKWGSRMRNAHIKRQSLSRR